MATSEEQMRAGNVITPEVLKQLLQVHNLSRQDFIETYSVQPLVYIPELPAGAKTTFVVMYAIIFVLALVGNSLVVYIVLRKRAVQTATNIFICSLAVSDLLITFFCIPFTLLQNISSEWLGGFVWAAAVIVGSPMLFVQQLEVKYDFLYDRHHVCCQECWQSLAHRQVYATFILVALFLLPLAAMLILYTRIGIELWIRKRVGDSSVLNAMNHREISKISRKKKRAVKMMITIVLLFTVCWAPFHIVHMLFEYNDLEKNYDEVTVNTIIAIVQAIGFFNSFNNPVVYAFMNENFKKHCMSALSCCLVQARRPAQEGPKMSVHFAKRDAFLDDPPKPCTKPHGSQHPALGTLRPDTSMVFVEEKISTVHSELPASSYSSSQ
ncbi:pyroglutamylated RF-amide peptide receptor isoform X2 [Scleropages formosus]|uniref:pyroglutamylated RF-amide peptide receptor isoform X2 n=1 Tax=Scleropages formosus TaxID=113540 RepID=UPI0010FA7FF5|nr:pyroglutamylated RF-amide peptide receptor-like isoform X2 [Scleropages formosus]